MYDEDYFRKIIGGNYKPSDYYANSTYEPNANVFPSEMYAQCKNSSNSITVFQEFEPPLNRAPPDPFEKCIQ